MEIQEDVPASILVPFQTETERSYYRTVFAFPAVTYSGVDTPGFFVDRSATTPSRGRTKSRYCFIESNGTARSVTVTGINPNGSGVELDLKCVETTLYGGFNTNANNFNFFLEITNTTNNTIPGTIYVTDFGRNVLINGVPFTVQSSRRVDFDLHTAVGPQILEWSKYCMMGPMELMVNTSYYKGISSDFTLTDTVPARPRDHADQ